MNIKITCIALFLILPTLFIYAQDDIIIKGVDRTGKKPDLTFKKWDKTFAAITYPNVQLSEITYLNDSVFVLTIKGLTKPALAYGLAVDVRSFDVILTPGDNLTAVIEPDSVKADFKVQFTGTNSKRYNYWHDLELNNVGQLYEDMSLVKDLSQLKKVFDNYLESTVSGINKYAGHDTLLSSILTDEVKMVSYYFMEDQAMQLPEHREIPFPLYSNLLADEQHIFSKPIDTLLLRSRRFTLGLLSAQRIMNLDTSRVRDLDKDSEVVRKFFHPYVQEYLYSTLFAVFSNRIKKNNDNDKLVNDWMKRITPSIRDSSYRNWVSDSYIKYSKINQDFPPAILDSKVTLIDGTAKKFRNVLNLHTGKPMIIDFWANWCGPCKQEFGDGKEVVENYKQKGFEFIYISVDKMKDFDKMKADVEKYGLKNTYMLDKETQSELAEYLNVRAIPRYVYISSDGQLLYHDLPKPSNTAEFNRLIRLYSR